MRHAFVLSIMVTASVAPLPVANAQEPPDELTPRAIADSTYGVRVAFDAFLEAIRQGAVDPRLFTDPQLVAAVSTLATAGAKRVRRPPRPEVGVLWDLQINLSDFRADGRDLLRVRADVFLATAPDSGRAPVTLTFRRKGDRWDLAVHEGLTARLIAIATALETRGRRP